MPPASTNIGGSLLDLALGVQHACAILTTGALKCWGAGAYGALGTGNTNNIGDQAGEMPPANTSIGGAAVHLTCGDAFTCVLLATGVVKCFGYNGFGQLGQGHSAHIGDQPGEMPPIDTPLGSVPVLSLSAGDSTACAVLGNGEVKCWGLTFLLTPPANELLIPAYGDDPGEMPPPSVFFDHSEKLVSATLGGLFVCGMSTDGLAYCWGSDNSRGQLGNGNLVPIGQYPDDVIEPVKIPPQLLSISVSSAISGDIITLSGIGFVDPADPSPQAVEVLLTGAQCEILTRTSAKIVCVVPILPPSTYYVSVLARGLYSPALPISIVPVANFPPISLSSSAIVSCLLTHQDSLRCFGSNYWGILGLNTHQGLLYAIGDDPGEQPRDVPLSGLKFSTIKQSNYHICGIVASTAQLVCWGNNVQGQCGQPTNGSTVMNAIGDDPGEMPPPFVNVGFQVAQIAPGELHTCALSVTNLVRCWGENRNGELGVGNTIKVGKNPGEMPPTANAILPAGTVSSIQAGSGYTCVLILGNVYCWGQNVFATLGRQISTLVNIGDDIGDMPPNRAILEGPVAELRVGYSVVCVIYVIGTAACWGDGTHGMLGTGATDLIGDDLGEMPPELMKVGFETVIDIGVGADSTCVLFATGRITCFGLGSEARLGSGSYESIDSPCEFPPAPVNLQGPVVSLAVGGRHVCVLLHTTDVFCFGSNMYGQLGIGSFQETGGTPSSFPLQASRFQPAISLALPAQLRPGDVLTLYGTGFGASRPQFDITVDFGGLDCPVLAHTGLTITCLVLSLSPGNHTASVTLAGLNASNLSPPVKVLSAASPILRGSAPASGQPGDLLTLNVVGAFVVSDSAVWFFNRTGSHLPGACGSSCRNGTVISVSPTTSIMTVAVPALPLGAWYDIVVTTLGGSSQPPYNLTFLACSAGCGECVTPGTAFGTQCLRCQESAGFVFNLDGSACVQSTACAPGEVLSNRTGALRCSCNQTAGTFLNVDSTACVESCALGQFLDTSRPNRICARCHASCLACVGTSFDECTACPAGFDLTTTVSLRFGDCSRCGLGFVRDLGTGRCFCPPGTYFDASVRSCARCVGSSFNPSYLDPAAGPTSETCTPCPAFTSMGATAPKNSSSDCTCALSFVPLGDGSCTCAPGTFFAPLLGVCLDCAADTFQPFLSTSATCLPCSSVGTYRSTNGATGRSNSSSCTCPPSMIPDPSGPGCVCAAGSYYELASSGCRGCPTNSFNPVPTTATQCTPCDSVGSLRSTGSLPTGQTSSAACSCPDTMIVDPTGATQDCVCPAGTVYDSGATKCRQCAADTFSNVTGLPSSCTPCLSVGAYRSTNGAVGSNSSAACVCIFSMIPDPSGSGCVCSAGSFFNGAEGRCSLCPTNSFNPVPTTATQCTPCDSVGSLRSTGSLPTGQTSSAACSCPDTMIVDPTGATQDCVCPAGTVYDSGATKCRQCAADTFSNVTGLPSSCTPCLSVGAYRSTNGAVGSNSSAACVCLASLSLNPLTQQCSCEPGQFYDSTSQRCRFCPVDTFLDSYSYDTGCTKCSTVGPHRSTQDLQGRTSAADCVCASGFFPSLDNSQCLSCSQVSGSVDCSGQPVGLLSNSSVSPVAAAGIRIKSGFWLTTEARFLEKSVEVKTAGAWFLVAKCPFSDACPGGSEAELCATGYTGTLCADCEHGYGKLGQGCASCPASGVSGFLVFLILIFVLIGCVFVVYFSRPEKLAADNSDSLRLKIAITHLQIIGFSGNFSTQWPQALVRVFAIPTSAATVSSGTDNIALDCATNPTVFTRAILTFVLPLILAGGVVLGFVVLAAFQRREISAENLVPKIKQGTIVLLYVAHPGIVEGVLKTLTCVDVGGTSFVRSDISVQCSDPAYVGLRAFSVLYLIVYGFGGLVLLLFSIRKRPEEFSFLTRGYRAEFAYWDVVVTIRKLVFVVISLFASASLQLFFGTWILLLSWVAHFYFAPYESGLLAKMDSGSLWVLLITVTTGSLYFSGTLGPTSAAGVAVSVILILLNFATVALFFFFAARKKLKVWRQNTMPAAPAEMQTI
eukprot:TRINITY_DN1060_c0_g1_i6.p1 TRINITY_DN1060_c0_g1~~TRINITY_DN1060_c0_g1_i6.p1  ORF type:complete len:2311 (-),score=422.95 TRINITY_DN1060_c0_g1_i6:14-6157(-)